MVLSFTLLNRQPYQVLSGHELSSAQFKQKSTLVETGRRPAFKLHTKGEAPRSEDFLDFVERLATQVRGLEQLVLGALDQVTDVVDVLGLQAVGRTHREFEFVDR